jgi:hypothetical protein
MIEQIKNIKTKVKTLLINFPHLRDSDNRLIANIWHSQIGKEKAKEYTAFDLLTSFSEGNLISPESIRRIRQKIQEQNPELRGESYKKRKEKAEEIRKEINKI